MRTEEMKEKEREKENENLWRVQRGRGYIGESRNSGDDDDPEDDIDAIVLDVNAFDDSIKMHGYGSIRKNFLIPCNLISFISFHLA